MYTLMYAVRHAGIIVAVALAAILYTSPCQGALAFLVAHALCCVCFTPSSILYCQGLCGVNHCFSVVYILSFARSALHLANVFRPSYGYKRHSNPVRGRLHSLLAFFLLLLGHIPGRAQSVARSVSLHTVFPSAVWCMCSTLVTTTNKTGQQTKKKGGNIVTFIFFLLERHGSVLLFVAINCYCRFCVLPQHAVVLSVRCFMAWFTRSCTLDRYYQIGVLACTVALQALHTQWLIMCVKAVFYGHSTYNGNKKQTYNNSMYVVYLPTLEERSSDKPL